MADQLDLQGKSAGPVPTERFHRVLAFASDEAEGLGHGFVTCQHMLCALARESKGLASGVLNSAGLSADSLHAYLEGEAAYHDRLSGGFVDLADELRDALDRAVGAAREWGHRTLDTEHLLYGLLVAPNSADDMLQAHRVDAKLVLEKLAAMQASAPDTQTRDEIIHAYRFTLESAWLLSRASDAAQKSGASMINSVHVLVGLCSQPGEVKELLASTFSVNEQELHRHIPAGHAHRQLRTRLPLSTDVQRILGTAIGEAWNRGHMAVTPMHIAVGLAKSDRSPALDLLADLGVGQMMLLDELESRLPPGTVR